MSRFAPNFLVPHSSEPRNAGVNPRNPHVHPLGLRPRPRERPLLVCGGFSPGTPVGNRGPFGASFLLSSLRSEGMLFP